MTEEITIAKIQMKGSTQNIEKMLKMIEEIEAIENVQVKLTIEKTREIQTIEKCPDCGQSCIHCLKTALDPEYHHPEDHECWKRTKWWKEKEGEK